MIHFMSKAAASFIMTDDVARQVLTAAGSEFTDRGIWTVERLPQVRQLLEQLSRRSHDDERAHDPNSDPWADEPRERGVSVVFYQRVMPVIDMLKQAEAEGHPIVWERL